MRALIATLLLVGCTNNQKCKPNTLFLTLEYGAAAESADTVVLDLVASDVHPSPKSFTKKGVTRDTIEIDFSSYTPGETVTVTATAYRSSSVVAENSLPVMLERGCTAATLPLDGGGDAGEDLASGDQAVSGPALQASPSPLVFGNVLVGAMSNAKDVAITNIGDAPATVSQVTVSPAGVFSLTDNCTGKMLAPSVSCTVSVVFSPQAAGPASASLTVTAAAGSPATTTLQGTGVTNPTSTFTVTYDGNGATGGTVPTDGMQYTSGQIVTVLGNPGALVKSGASFGGWNTQANGGGTTYTASSTFAIGSADVTLYAVWSAGPTYTVTYDGNGATGGAVPTDDTHYTQGQMVTVLGNSNLVKTGFTFTGWNTAANGSGAGYVQGNMFAIGASNLTLYAQWTANPTYTVTYDGNGSTGGTVPVDNTHYEQGRLVGVLGNNGNLVRTGYTFAGWNTAADGSGTAYQPANTFTMGSANVILYAQWMLIPTYTVTYDGNGATSGTVPTDSTHYTQGQTVTVKGNTGNLVKGGPASGNTFSGWNTQADGNGATYNANDTFPMGSANVTLYAKWTPCGDKNQTCCAGQMCLTGKGLICAAGNTCQTCGLDGGPCCGQSASSCSGESCLAGICTHCGWNAGDPCCPGNMACAGSLICSSGTCIACGSPGQPCCAPQNCSATGGGTGCCVDNVCVDAGSSCGRLGGVCQNNGSCGGSCGTSGQSCCSGTCTAYTLCSGGSCTYCGGDGQPCCPGAPCIVGYCTAGNTCNYTDAPDKCGPNHDCRTGCCDTTTNQCVNSGSSCKMPSGTIGTCYPSGQCG